jgi:AcrR family transcriptional regulator
MKDADSTEQKLTRKQEAALVALLEKGTVREAAAACNLSEATLYRYLTEPAFVTRYRDSRLKLVETGIARLQSAVDLAVNTLCDIAEDKEAPATARIAAAKTIIEQAMKGVRWCEKADEVMRPEHKHICGKCLEQFSCFEKDCADFEIGVHPTCKGLPHEREVTP